VSWIRRGVPLGVGALCTVTLLTGCAAGLDAPTGREHTSVQGSEASSAQIELRDVYIEPAAAAGAASAGGGATKPARSRATTAKRQVATPQPTGAARRATPTPTAVLPSPSGSATFSSPVIATPSPSGAATPSPSTGVVYSGYLVAVISNTSGRTVTLSRVTASDGSTVTLPKTGLSVPPTGLASFVDPTTGQSGPTLLITRAPRPLTVGYFVTVTFAFSNGVSLSVQAPVVVNPAGTSITSPIPAS
jgi:hypothetical protein